MSDAPERRRANASPDSSSSALHSLKTYRIPIIIVVLWVAIVGATVTFANPDVECPGHWHSTFNVFVDDEKVPFAAGNPQYTFSGDGRGGQLPLRTHMHSGADNYWHFEPSTRECIDLSDPMKRVDMVLRTGELSLTGQYHESNSWGGVHQDNETHQVRAFLKEWGQDWASISPSKLAGMQVPDSAQVLIVYGDETAADPANFESRLTQLPSGTQAPASGGSAPAYLGNLIGLTVFTSVALIIWFSMTKKMR
jgi:hypothetical protein